MKEDGLEISNGLDVDRMRGSRMTPRIQLQEPNEMVLFIAISWGWEEAGESMEMTLTLTLSPFINTVDAASMAEPVAACLLRKITGA